MTVLGLGFHKITLEKTAPLTGKVNVNNNASIKNVEATEIDIGKGKQATARFTFEFKSSYEPNIGFIQLEGEVLWTDKKETVDALVKEWKKDKKVQKDVMSNVLNIILSRSNVEALVLSRELNLPPPIPLPKVQLQ